MYKEKFETRHIGPQAGDVEAMLNKIGASTIDELIDNTIPKNIRLKEPLNISAPLTEFNYLSQLKTIANKNKLFKSYIGMGYYNCIVPPVIQRNVLENPGWYTAYTPYQAEIAQGRLEALLNFQTMVCDLTGLEIANASLLDEATAAAEGMIMFYHNRGREAIKSNANKFFVSELCFPQTIDVLKTRALPLNIELVIGNHENQVFDKSFFGTLLQYPAGNGEVYNYTSLAKQLHEKEIKVAVASDLMALVLLTPPGEWGADVVVGNSQRFGVPMGYGGPHAAFFATTDEFKRNIPGRIIGVSKDKLGNAAMRMALQTREQHIRRDKATSNICTAQALLAVMASMYAVYHGANGLKKIATDIHQNTVRLATELKKHGFKILNHQYFDTIVVTDADANKIKQIAEQHSINFRYFQNGDVSISLDETVAEKDIQNIVLIFCESKSKQINVAEINLNGSPSSLGSELKRTSPFLTHPNFSKFHSETEMMRYLKRLENKDLSLVHSMIALGSCTMKLNAASELMPITWPEFANIHPFVPVEQTAGYQEIFTELKKDLCEITGFDGFSLQPNSGAQGEYAGLMVIRNYHLSRGDGHRNIALIPSSAHGTNPASAVMAGMEVVVTKCDEKGNIDLADLQAKIDQHKNNISCLMVTYPSTHGVFEADITAITEMVHKVGGQVYMDGANMNAQVGLTSPGNIGADVCHLNLHKTFAIPHGGGGPGMGPIGVKKHLVPFLSGHSVISNGDSQSAVSAAPWGSALILLISYGYIKMLGAEGITNATKYAILNANYIKHKLDGLYEVLYQGENNTVAHEMILDCRSFKTNAGIEVEDIAKRLMDYGFHAPTVSFPVAGTIMIEPTESESKEELDRFCEAMISIHKEIKEVETGKVDRADNVLKHAPHTVVEVMDDNWNHSYSRKKAAFPLPYIKEAKFWPSVSRIDSAFGDRNLICTCPSVESYAAEEVAS